MDSPISDLKSDIRILRQLLRDRNVNLYRLKPKEYVIKIHEFKSNFLQRRNLTIAKTELSKLYSIIGRLKFYDDNMLYVYLEVEEQEFKDNNNITKLSTTLAWPILCTWKVEIIDENDKTNKAKRLQLGKATCILNRPGKGLKSYSNDWLSINLGAIENFGSISQDGSVTMRWKVLTKPFVHDVCVEEFQQLLDRLEKYCDTVTNNCLNAENLKDIKHIADKVLEKRRENKEQISGLEIEAKRLSARLGTIESEFEEFERSFRDLLEQHINPLLDCFQNGRELQFKDDYF